VIFVSMKKVIVHSTCMHYDDVVPLSLYCAKLGYFLQLQLTKGALIFRLEVSYNLLGQGFQTLVDYLSQL